MKKLIGELKIYDQLIKNTKENIYFHERNIQFVHTHFLCKLIKEAYSFEIPADELW